MNRNNFFKALFIVLVIGAGVLLSTAGTVPVEPAADNSEKVLSQVRKSIRANMSGLPEEQGQLNVVAEVEKISGIKKVHRLEEGEYLGSLCEEQRLEKNHLYLVFPEVVDQEGGIYGALYALSKDTVRIIVVPSPLAEATDPRVDDLKKEIDNKVMTCDSPEGS